MKIKFGPSRREKEVCEKNWQPWFAWFPVRLSYRDDRGSREGRWLETVVRRRWVDGWEYKSLKEFQESQERNADYERRMRFETRRSCA